MKIALGYALTIGLCFFSAIVACSTSALAVPQDDPIRVLILGDSIVSGIQDNKAQEGFVGRLRQRLPGYMINSIGMPGADTLEVLTLLAEQPNSELARSILDLAKLADIIIITIGINDFWNSSSAMNTALRIRLISAILRIENLMATARLPQIAVATLVLPGNSQHKTWAWGVNSILLSGGLTNLNPALRFDKLERRQFSRDKLHPNASGYTWMAEQAFKYLTEIASTRACRTQMKASYPKGECFASSWEESVNSLRLSCNLVH